MPEGGADTGGSWYSGAYGALGNAMAAYFGAAATKGAAKKQIRYAKEFAQKGIQWRVADAKAAGIHPLAALGVSTAAGPSLGAFVPDYSGYGRAAEQLGQAVESYSKGDIESKAAKLTIQGLEQDVRYKRLLADQIDPQKVQLNVSDLDTINLMGSMGQANAGARAVGVGSGYTVVPNEVPATEPGRLGMQAGWKPWNAPYLDSDGYYVGGPDMEGAQKLQDMSVAVPYYLRRSGGAVSDLWSFTKSLYDRKGFRDWYWKSVAKLPKIPKGWVWLYNPLNFSWRVSKGSLPLVIQGKRSKNPKGVGAGSGLW